MREREVMEEKLEPSLAEIPRFHVAKKMAAGAGGRSQELQQYVNKIVQSRLRDCMASMVLETPQIDQLWRLLKQHVSPPQKPGRDCINYDDFCQVADIFSQTADRAAGAFFSASHFLKFPHDEYGRISVIHFFHWVRRKNALMRTRVELSAYDTAGNGLLTERELEQWASDLIPSLPALEKLSTEFFQFYKVTVVRKFLFFLDPKRRGKVSVREMLAHPILHELLELRRVDISTAELRSNWFSLEHAEMLYLDYLELDADQNGMLSAAELSNYRGGGLTYEFVQRVFQECHTYRNKESGQSEIDYKSYLDFVLAMTYRGTPEALAYFFRLLDMRKNGRLTPFEISYFFRAVLDKFEEIGEEPNCTVEDVTDEIFDMVKPKDPHVITLSDLLECKVGETVVGMLTDVNAFWQYDRREQLMGHGDDDA